MLKTLLELLAEQVFNTELVLKERICKGRVYLENRDSSYNLSILEQNDEIRHHNPSVIEPSVPNEVEILNESEEFLAVFKPSSGCTRGENKNSLLGCCKKRVLNI